MVLLIIANIWPPNHFQYHNFMAGKDNFDYITSSRRKNTVSLTVKASTSLWREQVWNSSDTMHPQEELTHSPYSSAAFQRRQIKMIIIRTTPCLGFVIIILVLAIKIQHNYTLSSWTILMQTPPLFNLLHRFFTVGPMKSPAQQFQHCSLAGFVQLPHPVFQFYRSVAASRSYYLNRTSNHPEAKLRPS